MSRITHRLALATLATLVGLTVTVAIPSDLAAQERLSDEEVGDRIRADVESLRNGMLARRDEAHALALTQRLLSHQDPRADRGLSDVLNDSSVPLSIIRQLIVAALIEPQKRLLPAVINRLLQDRDSDFDASLDGLIRANANSVLVHKLAALAIDPTQREGIRIEAARTLGRTGKAAALDPLAKLWGSANQLMRRTAGTAFARIMPVGFASGEEAQKALGDLRRRGLTPWDFVVEKLAERRLSQTTPVADIESEHLRLALALVERADLDQLLTLYVQSSVPAVRRVGIARVAAFPYDSEAGVTARAAARRKAGQALLLAVPTETDAAARDGLYQALNVLVGDLQDWKVPDVAYAAVLRHAHPVSGEKSSLRRNAIRFLGKLRDARALEPLQTMYDEFGDADWTTRVTILDALDSIAPKQLLGWMIARVRGELHEDVSSRLILLIGGSQDPAAVAPLRELLTEHANQRVRWKAGRELGVLWKEKGFADARMALLEVGLKDPNHTVRITASDALSQAGEVDSGNRAALIALQERVETDDDERVRAAAARSILSLDEGGGVAYLQNSFAESDTIWALYQKTVVDEAMARGSPARAVAAATFLASRDRPELLARAFTLLEAMAAARGGANATASLWTVGSDQPVRGVVRRQLAALLLDYDRPADALRWLEQLLAANRRPTDPYAEWQWMAARALRALALVEPERAADKLVTARRHLDAARATEELSAVMLAKILLELAEVELDDGHPGVAHAVLSPDTSLRAADETALKTVDALTLSDLRKRVATADASLGRQILAWFDAGYGVDKNADAQRRFKARGSASARHLRLALAAETDVSRAALMLDAASDLSGESFAVDVQPGTTLATLQPTLAKALRALGSLAR